MVSQAVAPVEQAVLPGARFIFGQHAKQLDRIKSKPHPERVLVNGVHIGQKAGNNRRPGFVVVAAQKLNKLTDSI
jgi:hypothetical protein